MPESLFRILPASLAACLSRLPGETVRQLEEVRIRESRPLEIVTVSGSRFVSRTGELSTHPANACLPTREECALFLDKLSNHSLYTLEEELRRGFITVRGGHRVGITGRAVLEKGAVRHIRDIAGFNVRIAREVPGAAKPLLAALADPAGGSVRHTLIVSPPGRGKTTLLRDLARHLSYGRLLGAVPWSGLKVAIVDERSELAASVGGVPSFDVGPRTDVLDACPKAEGMMMMIRAMSPDVLVVDEIGRPEDADSVREAMLSGVRVLATAHGESFADVAAKSALGELVRNKRFGRYVLLGRRTAQGLQMKVLDENGAVLAMPGEPGSPRGKPGMAEAEWGARTALRVGVQGKPPDNRASPGGAGGLPC